MRAMRQAGSAPLAESLAGHSPFRLSFVSRGPSRATVRASCGHFRARRRGCELCAAARSVLSAVSLMVRAAASGERWAVSPAACIRCSVSWSDLDPAGDAWSRSLAVAAEKSSTVSIIR